jgi:hypothetical protein
MAFQLTYICQSNFYGRKIKSQFNLRKMKPLIILLTFVLCLNTVNAQFSENFDQDIVNLPGKCWSYSNVNYTTTSTDVINGTGSAYTNPPTSSSGIRSITTPYLNVNSTSFTVSFKYKTSSKINGNSTRTIEIVLVSKTGAAISLQTLTMDNNTPTSVLTLNNTYTLSTTGVYRLELRIGGATGDGNSRVIFDDLYASASPYYATFCNPAATAVNNSYSSNIMSSVSGNVLTNDNIPTDNDTYTAVLVSAPTQGTLVLNANGTFTYTPVAGFTGGNIIFTYQVVDNGYAPATSNTATVSINYAVAALLPIKVLSFDAAKEGSSIKISWKVSDNETGDFFVVEKSADGKNFTAIETVQTNGMKGVSEYTSSDNASAGTTYYRLKIVNRDNSVSYSKVVIVKGENENVEVKVLNNPATANLNINYKADKQINSTLKVYSMSGAQVYQTKLNVAAGTNNISVPVSHLQNGSYVVVIDSVQGRKAIQFVKK